jgi:hypothetical protein
MKNPTEILITAVPVMAGGVAGSCTRLSHLQVKSQVVEPGLLANYNSIVSVVVPDKALLRPAVLCWSYCDRVASTKQSITGRMSSKPRNQKMLCAFRME